MRAEVLFLILFGLGLASVHALKTDYTVSEYGAKDDQVRVVVILKPDFLPEKLAAKKEKIRGLQRRLLSKAPGFTPIHRYDTIPALSGLANPRVIATLGKLPMVERVYIDRIAKITLTESVPLINATHPWAQGFSGQDQGILVVDTGVDYTHEALGSPGCTITTSIEGDVQAEVLESPHPYPDSYDYTWTITKPGFESIAVHFVNVSVERGYDFVYVYDAEGNIIESYTGFYEDRWSLSVPGDTIKIRLKSDSIVNDYGFYIDKVLNGSVKASFNNCGRVKGGYDFVNHDHDPMDDHGHGTHVAGIAASNDTTYRGVAPNAGIIAAKVLNSAGSGYFSDVAAAIDWGIINKERYNISVISMSLGDGGEYNDPAAQCDPYATAMAINTAFQQGIFVAVASGNEGYTNGVSYPACASNATSVGAVYDADVGRMNWAPTCVDTTTEADKIVCFTNRDEILDLLAPGSVITSTLLGGGFGDMSGTSMAAPHVSGVAALMKSKNPSLTPGEIRDKMKATGVEIYDPDTGLTFKRADASEAVASVGFDYAAKARQAMEYVTSASNSYIDQDTGLLWSASFTGDLSNAAPCYDGSYFYHTARAIMGMHATGVRTDLADMAVNRVFVANYRENGTWGYPHEPWFGRMGYENNDGLPWPNNSLYEDAQAWQGADNVLIAAKALATTGAYSTYVERLIEGIINQSVPVKGGYMYNSSTGAMQYYNGSTWLPATRYTAQFVAILRLTDPVKYSQQIEKGMEYLDNNTLAYIDAYPEWQHFLAAYFLSTHALMGNKSMVDELFSKYIAGYRDGVNFTHEIQLTHAGNASINSVLYHASGLNALREAYLATGNETYLAWAREIADHMLLEHYDPIFNYFTNLNEMNTSRPNYCNYQKALAEINGVAAYALTKLAAANSSEPGNSSDTSSSPSIQVLTGRVADYTRFKLEAEIAGNLEKVILRLGPRLLNYSVSGDIFASECLGPFAKGTVLNFTIIAEDSTGDVALEEFTIAVEEGGAKLEGEGKLKEKDRSVKIELEAGWKKGEAKGEFELQEKGGKERFKAHGKIESLYRDCDGVFRISGVARVESGESRNKVRENVAFTGWITGEEIRIAIDGREYVVPARIRVTEKHS
jgi:subtilisin family serine protease